MSEQPLIHTVRAFTTDPTAGNVAAVVLDADGLEEQQMQAIARVMGFSETAFVLPTGIEGVAFRLRWFTPTVEVSLCGHATVATLKILADEGRLPVDGSAQKIETQSGVLRIGVEKKDDRQIYRLQVPVPKFRKVKIPDEKAKTLFGLYQSDQMTIWPTVTDGDHLFIPVISTGTLRKLRPDFARMKSGGGGEYPAVAFFTGESFEIGHTWHCRFFAPGFGINEDPVTGAVNGPLGAYYYQYVDTVKPPRAEYIGEQGDIINSPGRVYVTVKGDGQRATDIEIGGEAVTVKSEPLENILRRLG